MAVNNALHVRVRITLAAVLMGMILLISFPVEAAEAARRAMEVWASAFAPALFPFLVMAPALSTPEASALYERVLGKATEKLFGCPGRVAGAITVAWLSGSPAGAIALSRVQNGMTRGQLSRAAILCSALSPGFLISSVGAGMLSAGEIGYALMRAQLLALVASGLILRRAWAHDGEPVEAPPSVQGARGNPVAGAVIDVLTVCGYMVCFCVLAQLVSMVLPGAGIVLLPLLEVTGGSAALASAIAPKTMRVVAVACACGLGGLSIFWQNAARLPGVPKPRLLLGKLMHAALMAAFTWAQLAFVRVGGMRASVAPQEAVLVMGLAFCVLVACGHFMSARRAPHEHG